MESPKTMASGSHHLRFKSTTLGRPIGSHEEELGAEGGRGGPGAGGGGGRATGGECQQPGCRGGETTTDWQRISANRGSMAGATIGGFIHLLVRGGWSQKTKTMNGRMKALRWPPDGMWGVRMVEEKTWGGQGGEPLVGTEAGCHLPMIDRVPGRLGGGSHNIGG